MMAIGGGLEGVVSEVRDVRSVRRRTLVAGLILGLPLACSVVVGAGVDHDASPPVSLPVAGTLLRIGLLWIALTVLIVGALAAVDRWSERPVADDGRRPKIRWWPVAALTMAACWTLSLLVFYPGLVSADSFVSMEQVIGEREWTNHHPVAYTALIALCLKPVLALGGSLTQGVLVYSVMQVLVMAAGLGWVVAWIDRQRWHRWAAPLTLAFFALDPIIGAYVVTMWKDIIFSLLIVLLTVWLWEMTTTPGQLGSRWHIVRLSFGALALVMIRSNGLVVVTLVIVALAVCHWRRARTVVAALAVTLVVGLGVTGPLYAAMSVHPAGSAESLAIPIQQVAYTLKYHPEGVTAEQRRVLAQFAPIDEWVSKYNPTNVNRIKFRPGFGAAFDAGRSEFLSTYLEMMPANLEPYVKAWLAQTTGYWHIGTTNWVVYPPWLHQGRRVARPGEPVDRGDRGRGEPALLRPARRAVPPHARHQPALQHRREPVALHVRAGRLAAT